MLNHVTLLGRIGQEVELRTTNNGTDVVTFRLAVQRNYDTDATDWLTIVAWRTTATFISKHFKKGDMICVEGSIQTRDYEDKDGKKVYITEIVAERVHFCANKREATTTNTADTNTFANDTADDFIPVEDDVKMPWD